MYSVRPVALRESSVASLMRCASPPDSVVDGLAELDVAQADVVHRLQLVCELWQRAEEFERFVDRHLQHLVDVLALIAHFERLAVVAVAVADLAGHVDVGEEVHLDLDDAVAGAGLAAPALDVEAEAVRACIRAPWRRAWRRTRRGSCRTGRCRWRGCERGVRPMGDWSMAMTLSSCSMPSMPSCAPARSRERLSVWDSDLYRISLTSDDLPLPDTPVTQVMTPSGNLTVDVLQVVRARLADGQPAGRLAARSPEWAPTGGRRGTGR